MIGEFLLTSGGADQEENKKLPLHLSGKHRDVLLSLTEPALTNKNDENREQEQHSNNKHNKHILLEGSDKTEFLLDWALILASLQSNSTICCTQCTSHPETCRCNVVDLILCSQPPPPQPLAPMATAMPYDTAPNPEHATQIAPSSMESHVLYRNTLDNPLFHTALDDEYSPESLALHRIRVHLVHSKRQFLSLLLQMQRRAISEQPRRAILVENLDKLAWPRDSWPNDMARTPGYNSQHARRSQQQRKRQHDLTLSQLSALLLDTVQWLNRARQTTNATASTFESLPKDLTLGIKIGSSGNMHHSTPRSRSPTWARILRPQYIFLPVPPSPSFDSSATAHQTNSNQTGSSPTPATPRTF